MKPLPLLLLPGLDGTGLLLEPFAKALSADFDPRIVRYPADRVVSYDELLASIELPRGDFGVVAESYGGPLAIKLAARKPPGLRGLVLSATFVRCPWPKLPHWMGALIRPGMFSVDPPDMLWRWVRGGFPEDRPGSKKLLDAIRRVDTGVIAARLREVLTVDVSDAFAKLATPLLYFAGKRDKLVPKRVFQELKGLRPGLGSATFDAPHFILQTRATEAAAAVAEFFRAAAS